MSFIRHRRATSPNKFEYRNYDSKKNFFDTSAVEAVIKLVIEYNPEAIMVIKSTIPVGYPYDAHQFAEAIENIVNLTPEARNQMAAACKKKAEEFDVSKSIAAMKNIYQEVLSNDRKYEE